MAEKITVDLKGQIPGDGSITFLRAELPPREYGIPFAVVRYSVHGKEQKQGLRLDLDKQVFADHFDDAGPEEALKRAAPTIVEVLHSFFDRTPFVEARVR